MVSVGNTKQNFSVFDYYPGVIDISQIKIANK